MAELSLQQYPTTDSELAAWLIYCGCTISTIYSLTPDTSMIILNCPNGEITEWVRQFEISEGRAGVARGMFRSHRELIRAIHRSRRENNS